MSNRKKAYDPDLRLTQNLNRTQDFLNGYASVSGMKLQEMQKKWTMKRIWANLSLQMNYLNV